MKTLKIALLAAGLALVPIAAFAQGINHGAAYRDCMAQAGPNDINAMGRCSAPPYGLPQKCTPTAIGEFCSYSTAPAPTTAVTNHTWYLLNYSNAQCERTSITPGQWYAKMSGPSGSAEGTIVKKIMPSDVTKDANGNVVSVTIRATVNGEKGQWSYFTSETACHDYVTTNGVTAQGVPAEDLN